MIEHAHPGVIADAFSDNAAGLVAEPLHVLLQTQVLGVHGAGGFFADVTIMPGLVADASQGCFFVRVALDEAVTPALLGEPIVEGRGGGADITAMPSSCSLRPGRLTH